MLAMRSLRLGSALQIGAMLTVISAATVLVACGDDPPPTPATATSTPSIATPEPVSLPSQGPPSKWLDYYRLMAENPAGFKSMVEKNIETLSEDIKRDAANVDAYVKRGAAYVGLYTYWGVAEDVGSVELAIVDFSKAIELDPSNPDAYIGLGVAYDYLRQRDRAIQEYHAAIKHLSESLDLDPKDVDALIDRAYIYRRLGEPQKALSDLDSAIGLDPGNPWTYLSRAGVHSQMGETDAAIRDGRTLADGGDRRRHSRLGHGHTPYAGIPTSTAPTSLAVGCTRIRERTTRRCRTTAWP